MNQLSNAHFDGDGPAVVITDLTITELGIVTEARRWSTGSRGEAVDVDAMTGVDLAPFVQQALTIGAAAIAAAGGAQTTFDLERLVTEVGTRTAQASTDAATQTSKAVTDATAALAAVAETAKKAMTDTDATSRRSLQEAVTTAQTSLRNEIERLVGGESPELVARLQPLLTAFGTELDAKVGRQTRELLATAAKQFDPSDPTSPMAKHSAGLVQHNKELSESLERTHQVLAGKVDELVSAVKVQTATSQATSKIANVTPIKGTTYANEIHAVMAPIAAGLGDEYTDTGAVSGRIARSKKGDGLLTVAEADARVLLEMTDSNRPGWNDYLEEAERNRDAGASLGLVRRPDQNAGQSIRVLSPRRIVMAFDPVTDDANLLRTVVMLLRTAAVAAAARTGADDIATAEEKLAEAVELLTKIDGIQKTAAAIHKGATKITGECDAFSTGIRRLLDQALAALAGIETTTDDGPAAASTSNVA